jgi:MFS family permease
VFLNRIAVKIAFFLNGFILANWQSRLPRIQERYNADEGLTSIVLFTMAVGAVLAMPFTGWFIIKHGSRRITLFSLIAYCALVPFIPVLPSFATLVILYFVMGFFTGMLDVAMNSQAVMVEQQYQKPIMTSFHALFSIGMSLGAAAGALFTHFDLDLLRHLSIVVAASLVAAFWVSRNLINDKPHQNMQNEGPLFRIPNKVLFSIGIIAFCCMMGEGAMADWTVIYMEKVARAAPTLAPAGLAAFAAAMTIGRLVGDKARASLGDIKLIMLGGIIATIGLSVSLLIPDPHVSIAGFFLVGLGLSTIVPITYSIAGNTKDLPPGVGLAMVTTVGYTGFLFGPPIIGFIADGYSLRIGLSVVVILFVIMTWLGIAQYSRTRT